MTIQDEFNRMRAELKRLYASPRLTPEESTEQYVGKYGGYSGIYILRQHCCYAAGVLDIYKIGRADCLSKRFKKYRGPQTIVFFIPTIYSRAAEKVAKMLLVSSVIHGQETVRAPLSAIIAAFELAVRLVHDAVQTLGHVAHEQTHQAYEQNLQAYVAARLGGNLEVAPIDSPQDTPLHPDDVHTQNEQRDKTMRRVERIAKRKRLIEDAAEKRVVAANKKRKRLESVAEEQQAHVKGVEGFLEDMCVLEQYRTVMYGTTSTKVRTFTPVDALWKAYVFWGGENPHQAILSSSKQFGIFLTPIVGPTKKSRFIKSTEPPDTWALWSIASNTDSRHQERGRFGIRFKTPHELSGGV